MRPTPDRLSRKIMGLSRVELETFATHIALSLYGEFSEDTLSVGLNQDKAIGQVEIDYLIADTRQAGIHPSQL